MKKVFTLLIVYVMLAMLAGCLGPKRADTFQEMAVTFEWNGHAGSPNSPSPEILIDNVPAGTAFFLVSMADLDMPSFNHGGGTVPYTGNVIPVGALKSYVGPHPPSTHRYVIKVEALNTDKSLELGAGKAMRTYP